MATTPTDQDDVITGTEQRDVVDALAGNDVVHGLGGNDDLSGGDGNDEVFGDAGNDSIGGNAGDDILHGGADDDILDGVGGHDVIYGDAGDDWLEGGPGDDILIGGTGNDHFYGNLRQLGFNGYDTAVVNTTVSDALIEFGRGQPYDPVETGGNLVPFVISSDGIDGFEGIRAIRFNDTEFSASGLELLQTRYAYQAFMGRDPTTAEYAFWESRGAEVLLPVQRDAILRSAEGQAAFGASVNDIYRMFAGRDATSAEIDTWNGQYQGSTIRDFETLRAHVIADNDGYVQQIITSNYEAIFGRAPTADESATWKQLFAFADYNDGTKYPYGFGEGNSHATPDTLVTALMEDGGSAGHIVELHGTSGADVFTLPAGFTDVHIDGFDPTQDKISFDGTAFAGTDPLDPALARQTTDAYYFGGQAHLDDGDVLLALDTTHRVLVEGMYSVLDREQYLSGTTNTTDSYYLQYFGRYAYSSEIGVWDRLYEGGATYDTLIDTLLKDHGSDATATQKLTGTSAADALQLSASFTNAVVTGFDPGADTLSTHSTAVAGIDPLAHAREITALDGGTDVLDRL